MEGILCLAMAGEGILPQKTHRGGLKALLAVAVQGVTVWQNSGRGGRKACYGNIFLFRHLEASNPIGITSNGLSGINSKCLDETLDFSGHQKGDKSHKE